MTGNEPLVSIVIPTFNREGTLHRALASALDQTYGNIEVVVTDNASTDGSLESIADLATDPRVRVLHSETNVGPVPNWRRGIEAANGEYVKVVWSDDWMEPNTVAALVQPLIENPTLGFSVCRHTIHTSEGELNPPDFRAGPIRSRDLIDSRTRLNHLPVSPGAALVRREDALWSTTCAFGDQHPQCHERAIGPDLLMLYGAFRRGDIGWWVADTQVHFTAGEDSISMTEESNHLRTCYLMALAYLIAESDEARDKIVVRRILEFEALRQPWSDTADTQQVRVALQQLAEGASPSDWVAGTTIAAGKSAQRAAQGLKRRIGRRSKKLP